MSKFTVICEHEHEFNTTYAYMIKRPWCRICNANKGIGLAEWDCNRIKDFVEQRNFKIISIDGNGIYSNITVECDKGHTSTKQFNSFKKTPYCAICNNSRGALSYNEVKGFIESIGYKLLSDEYISYTRHLDIVCDKGHEYSTSFASIKGGSKCPICDAERFRGKSNPLWKGGISNIKGYLRGYTKEWRKRSIDECNGKCILTGKSFDVVHHLTSFNIIIEELFDTSKLTIEQNISNYSRKELDSIVVQFKALHDEKYPLGVCLDSELHEIFHQKYGRGDNTPKQFDEFVKRYQQGEFDYLLGGEVC